MKNEAEMRPAVGGFFFFFLSCADAARRSSSGKGGPLFFSLTKRTKRTWTEKDEQHENVNGAKAQAVRLLRPFPKSAPSESTEFP